MMTEYGVTIPPVIAPQCTYRWSKFEKYESTTIILRMRKKAFHHTRTPTRDRFRYATTLALLYVLVPSGLVTNDASPAALRFMTSLPTAARSISITEGVKEGGRSLISPDTPLRRLSQAPWRANVAAAASYIYREKRQGKC